MRNEIPTVICLCGSTRFTDVMLVIQWEFAKKGHIVLGWNALPDSYFNSGDTPRIWLENHKANVAEQEGVKELIDELHKRKIDLSDEVFVLNIGGYIGESTRSEIDYALDHGKPVHYLMDGP